MGKLTAGFFFITRIAGTIGKRLLRLDKTKKNNPWPIKLVLSNR